MNILIYAPNYLPATRYGGPIRSSHGLASALARAGHHVRVLTTDVDGPDRLDVPRNQPVYRDGVEIRYFPTRPPRRLYFAPDMAQAAGAALDQADILHLNGCFLWPGPALARQARRAGVGYVVSPRGMLQADLIAGKSTLAKRLWITGVERPLLARAGAIHATSDAELAGLADLGLTLAPTKVIGNGIDAAPPAPGPDPAWQGLPRGRRVAFLGRLDWTKGVDLALAAAQAVPGAVVRIAGPDPIGLKAQLIERGFAAPSMFTGPLSDTRKWAFLAGADVVIAPSVRESFGLTVAEALSVGTPVICTPGVGAAPMVAGLDAACVVPRDVGALSTALRDLLDSPARRAHFANAAPPLMRRDFGWDRIAAQMVQLYRDARLSGTETRAKFGTSEPVSMRSQR